MIAVLGAGPHGRQLAALQPKAALFDDHLPGYKPCAEGARRHHFVIGAAWPRVRRQIADQVGGEPYRRGVVVFPGAKVGVNVTLGDHTHVGWNAVVAHGATLGSCVTVCPGAVVSGEAVIEDDVFVGANATVIHGGVKVGAGAVIGAGAVVLGDVPPGVTVVGAGRIL